MLVKLFICTGTRIFDCTNKDSKYSPEIRTFDNNFIVKPGFRVEIRIACVNSKQASDCYEILKNYSMMFPKYKSIINFIKPPKFEKLKLVEIQDFNGHFNKHALDLIDKEYIRKNMKEFEWLKKSGLCAIAKCGLDIGFDGQGHVSPITSVLGNFSFLNVVLKVQIESVYRFISFTK